MHRVRRQESRARYRYNKDTVVVRFGMPVTTMGTRLYADNTEEVSLKAVGWLGETEERPKGERGKAARPRTRFRDDDDYGCSREQKLAEILVRTWRN